MDSVERIAGITYIEKPKAQGYSLKFKTKPRTEN